MDDKGIAEEGEIHDEENDDDKEDVPDNFFDDFNNEGFMESLQIVDSLDDTNLPEEIEENENDEVKQQNVSTDKIKEKSLERNKKKRSREHDRSRSRERKYRNESPRRKRKFDNAALRRDPNKTKRDLEKDRENFFKKKEQKVISKIVETGLVPPGMESEVNMNVIESENSKDVAKGDLSTKLEENETKLRDRRASRERSRNMSKERRRRSRSRSYGRYRSRSRSRGRWTERRRDKRKSFERHITSRSRDRSRERGRVYERDLYSPSKNRRRRSRSGSIERERWLKERDRSPEKKYQGMIKEKKMSFLEEIKMKLNGDTGAGGDMVTYPFPKNLVQPKFPEMRQVSAGSALPPYNQNYQMADHSAPPMISSYNEDFFIGNQTTGSMHPNVAPMHLNLNPMHPNVLPMQPNLLPIQPNLIPMHTNVPSMHTNLHTNDTIQTMPVKGSDQSMVKNSREKAYNSSVVPVPPPSSTADISNKVSELMARISASTNSSNNKSRNSPQVENQWSLTDFLHLQKPTEFSSDSEALKKKVDVLSRCQDFLKELSGDKQFSGKLKVMKTSRPLKDGKNISPLLRQQPIKFSFNAPMSESSYQDTLNRTLIKLGVVTDVIDLVGDDDEEDSRSLSIPAIKRNKVPFEINPETPKLSVSMKMCQTDPVKCEDCEKRKAVQYTSIGIQCGESERYNVGLQVNEEDIINYRIQKTQSLAYMTPAQLLGRSDAVVTRPDNFGVSSSERPSQQAYRDAMNWNRPRDYYDELGREYPEYQGPSYYGPGRDAARDPRYSRF